MPIIKLLAIAAMVVAKGIGLIVPQSLLARADEVIVSGGRMSASQPTRPVVMKVFSGVRRETGKEQMVRVPPPEALSMLRVAPGDIGRS